MMNKPTLSNRPLLCVGHLALGPLWNVRQEDADPTNIRRTNDAGPLPQLLDCEGVYDAVAEYLRTELTASGFVFHDCFLKKKFEMDELLVDAREADMSYRGQVAGHFKPLDRTLEIPAMDSEILSTRIVQGLCDLLRAQHPLWRVSVLGPGDMELMIYPDCVRKGNVLCLPSDSAELVGEWKQSVWEYGAPRRRRCREMESVMPLIQERWPEVGGPPAILRIFPEGQIKYVWILFPMGRPYFSLNVPSGSEVGQVEVDTNLMKYSLHKKGLNTCWLTCEQHSVDVSIIKYRDNNSGQMFEIPLLKADEAAVE